MPIKAARGSTKTAPEGTGPALGALAFAKLGQQYAASLDDAAAIKCDDICVPQVAQLRAGDVTGGSSGGDEKHAMQMAGLHWLALACTGLLAAHSLGCLLLPAIHTMHETGAGQGDTCLRTGPPLSAGLHPDRQFLGLQLISFAC